MLKKLDSSEFVIKFLERLSTLLARRRGLPAVIGITLIIVGFILEIANIGLGSQPLEFLHTILRNIGILVALVGLLLAEPLGQ